jgi:hypothetical protein
VETGGPDGSEIREARDIDRENLVEPEQFSLSPVAGDREVGE